MRRFSFKPADAFKPSVPGVRRYGADSGKSLGRLFKQINRLRRRRPRSYAGDPGTSIDRRQLCIVKVRYGHGAASLRAHLSYIQRKGAGKDGERPQLLGGSDKSELTTAEPSRLRHYRIVVSPEAPEHFPLSVLATKLVQRIERDTGYSLSWVATIHENTEHNHIHLVISGQDKNGLEVAFSRKYISSQLREHTREILTEALGDRRPLPEALRLKKEIGANRFTSLDEIIRRASGTIGLASSKSIRASTTPEKAEAAIARLKFLVKVGLASREGTEYRVCARWEESLAVSRRFASYLEAARQLKFTPQSMLQLYSPDRDGRIVGRLSAVGLIDELSTNNYLLIETIDGRAFYVPLYRKPRGIRVGDSIALMKVPHQDSQEIPPTSRKVPSTSTNSMSLLDIRFAKMPDEKLKAEVKRLGKNRGGFGLHLQ